MRGTECRRGCAAVYVSLFRDVLPTFFVGAFVVPDMDELGKPWPGRASCVADLGPCDRQYDVLG